MHDKNSIMELVKDCRRAEKRADFLQSELVRANAKIARLSTEISSLRDLVVRLSVKLAKYEVMG